jgi:SusD family.
MAIGCDKLIDVGAPKNQLSPDQVFSDSSAVSALLANTYALFERTVEVNISRNMALYADELGFTQTTTQQVEFWNSVVSPDNSANLNIWRYLYAIIYQCNDLLAQLPSSSISVDQQQAVAGQAKFLRAFSYFYLVNFYQNVPLVLSIDVNTNRIIPQSDQSLVYDQILADLREAKTILGTTATEGQNTRANGWSVAAMLAKVYFAIGEWEMAVSEATEIINSGRYRLEDLDRVFLTDSRETILQFWTQDGFVTSATSLVPSSATVLPSTLVTDVLYETFETSDLRRSQWIGTNVVTTNGIADSYHFPYKYRNRSAAGSMQEHLVAIRLGELYLIRAEAYANLNRIDKATADLNTIRNRAGLSNLSANDSETALNLLADEFQREMFVEWGARFINLKRMRKLDEVIGGLKSTWKPYAENLPIPQNELLYNPNLIQNNGY